MSPVWGSTVSQPAESFPTLYLWKKYNMLHRSSPPEKSLNMFTWNKHPTYTKSLAWLESGSTAVTFSTQVPMGAFSSSMASLTVTLNTGGSLVSSTSMRTSTEWGRPAPASSPVLVSTFQRPEDVLPFTLQEKYGTSFSTEMDSCLCAASSKSKGWNYTVVMLNC